MLHFIWTIGHFECKFVQLLDRTPFLTYNSCTMTTLIIDTSTDLCIVALAKKGKILTHSISAHQNRLSKRLLPCIQELLHNQNLTPSDLSGIALGIGPGSYTGTRLGASVAKTLSFALEIPLYPFHSPCAFIPNCAGPFAFLIATKPGPYFVLKGTLGKTLKQESTDLIPVESLASYVETQEILIHSELETLPPFLSHKSSLHATTNLPLLASYLTSIPPSDPDSVMIEYLHTPHLLLKNIFPIP
jgi:tRNA threonylcarbamoyl adenosine modification protein YeaZ